MSWWLCSSSWVVGYLRSELVSFPCVSTTAQGTRSSSNTPKIQRPTTKERLDTRPSPRLSASQVVPPEYGTSRDPLKLLTSIPQAILKWAARRWRRLSPASSRRWAPLGNTDNNDTEGDSGGVLLEDVGIRHGVGVEGDPADFEPLEERGGEKLGVVIAGLRKEFGSKVAVAGLDLRLLPGDITCLLGHNGAGEDVRVRFARSVYVLVGCVSGGVFFIPCEQVVSTHGCTRVRTIQRAW